MCRAANLLRLILLVLLSSAFVAGARAAGSSAADFAPPPLWGSLAPGSFNVGFRVIEARDDTRSWRPERAPDGRRIEGTSARPVRISVWYPAAPSRTARAMTYADYVHIAGSTDFRELNEVLARREINLLHRIVRGPAAVAALMRAPVAAVRDAVPAAGRFPIIGYTPGLNAYLQHGNFVLCELLASHGYVVVTVPQVGTSALRLEFGIDPVSLETQMRDIEFAIAGARRLPIADAERVALIGHSMGGVSSVVTAMRDSRIDAVIGLDASYSARPLIPTLAASPFYNPRQLRVPWLDLRRAANEELDSSALEALHFADRYQLLLRGVAHSDFTSFPMIAANFPTDIAGRTPAHASRVYELVARTILRFLDPAFHVPADIEARLRGGIQAPADHGLVEQFVHWPRQPAPLSAEELAFLIARDGLERATAGRPAGADKNILNGAGYRLLEWQRTELATAVFRRNVELHPGDSNLLDSLAEGYLAARRFDRASAVYREVLAALAGDTALSETARETLRRNALAQLELIEQLRSWGGEGASR